MQRFSHPSEALRGTLREAMAEGGCPLCRLVERDEQAFLQSLTYERILDLKTRDALLAARTLCLPHARRWQAVQGSALGIALVCEQVLGDLLRRSEEENGPRRRLRRRASLERQAPCPACAVGEATARRFASVLLYEITDPQVAEAFLAGGGLCLDHLLLALRASGPEAGRRRLLDLQRRLWEALRGELAEFIRKNDYRFRDEPLGEERDAWIRALLHLASRR